MFAIHRSRCQSDCARRASDVNPHQSPRPCLPKGHVLQRSLRRETADLPLYLPLVFTSNGEFNRSSWQRPFV
jgi:hypothetical protein